MSLRRFATTGLFLSAAVIAAPAGADVLELRSTQTSYSFEDGSNAVRITWRQTGDNPGGVDILLDGARVANVPGSVGPNETSIAVESPGDHVFKARVGGTVLAQAPQRVFEEQPMGDARSLTCVQAPADDDCEITVTFTNPGPEADAYLVYLDGEPAAQTGGGFGAMDTPVPVDAPGEHCVIVVGVIEKAYGNYLGDPVEACCSVTCGVPPGNRFLRGLCNGAGSRPDISSAVFGLVFLFSGGAAPPCREACDSNGDGRFDLSDMVHVLGYLFLGGPPPRGWTDADSDGQSDPTCEAAPAEACEAAHEACSG